MKTITCSYRFCATDISVDGKTLYTTASTDKVEAGNLKKLLRALGGPGADHARRYDQGLRANAAAA
jgi:hypothetical protein